MQSKIARVASVLAILYGIPIPLAYKIVLVMMTDALDHQMQFDGDMMEYDINDKISDILGYGILLYYILSHGGLPKRYNTALVVTFVYRLVGQILFHRTRDRRYLTFFPNIFILLSLILVALHALPQGKHQFVAIGLVVVGKFVHERYHHMPRQWVVSKIKENEHIQAGYD
tara:strand:- start:1595 stop:2107 length:513 start_codon:yes stop_codon:yes gene_type:complete